MNTSAEAGTGPAMTAKAECEAAVIEVLETMFFELPVDGPGISTGPPDHDVAVTAAFSGDLEGELSLACGHWAMRRLAASFLGREDDSTVTGDEIHQVACELANMVCGNALSRIEPHGRFRIATPELRAPDACAQPWITFPLDSGVISVRLEAGR